MSEKKIRIIPLGGLGEIGKNCLLLESDQEMIMIDCGVMFSDLDAFGVHFVVPDFSYVLEKKDKLKAIIVTHAHEDHIGALPYLLRAGIRAPIYTSPFSSLMVGRKLAEHGHDPYSLIHPMEIGSTVKWKDFEVRSLSVNHSIIEACALVIKTPVGTVVHTGDFKIDPTPFYGSMIDLQEFGRVGDQGVRLLLSDSTSIEKETENPSELEVYHAFDDLLKNQKGMTLVSMFSSNVGRMGQIFKLAFEHKKKVFVMGRSMDQNLMTAKELGYVKEAKSCLYDLSELPHVERKDRVIMVTGSQGEYKSALARIAQGEHRDIKIERGDQVVFSSRMIPGNEKAVFRMINNLYRQGADVIHDVVKRIHVSGHASKPELQKMLELTKPKFFIPVHGEYRHLVKHGELAKHTGVRSENIAVVSDGDIVELTEDKIEIVDVIPDTKTLIEGTSKFEVPRILLKDRRKLAEAGVCFVWLVRDRDSGGLLRGPFISLRGVVKEELEGHYTEEALARVKKVFQKTSPKHDGDFLSPSELEEMIRIEVRRFFYENLHNKPTVLPLVLDL